MPFDVEQLGREAAQQVAGPEAVEQVEVATGYEFDRPVYRFTFLIDQGRALLPAGLLRTRLSQRLRDGLEARNDERQPVLRILDRTDWEKRGVA